MRDNDEMRKAAENWWCLLSHFQSGVGAVPIDVEISKDNPAVKEWRERKERVEKWLEIAVADDEKYERKSSFFASDGEFRFLRSFGPRVGGSLL